MKFASKYIFSIALKSIATVLALGTSMLLARTLGPDGFGAYTYILAMVGLLALPFQAGTYVLISREATKAQLGGVYQDLKGLIAGVSLYIIFGGVLLVLLALAFVLLGSGQGNGYMIAAALLVPLIALDRVRSALLQGINYPLLSQLTELVVRPGLLLLVLVLMVWFESISVALAVNANLLSLSCAFLAGLLIARRKVPSAYKSARTAPAFLRWLPALIPLSLLSALQQLNGQTDILILGWRSTSHEVGLYKSALQVSGLIVFFQTAILAVSAAQITSAYQRGDSRDLQRVAIRTFRIIVLLSLPIFLVLIFWGKWILGALFGLEYRESYYALAMLTASQALNLVGGVSALVMKMTGKESVVLRLVLCALSANICLAIPLASYGATGVAISTAVASLVLNVAMAIALARSSGINLFSLVSPPSSKENDSRV